MNSFTKLLGKLVQASDGTPSPEAVSPLPGRPKNVPRQRRPAPLPSVVEIPPGLMEELFPKHGVMVSVVFDEPVRTDIPLLDVPPPLPESKSQPRGKYVTPEVLPVPDDLREDIFPKQKVMVSVIFNVTAPKPLTPEPGQRYRSYDDPSHQHDYPIV